MQSDARAARFEWLAKLWLYMLNLGIGTLELILLCSSLENYDVFLIT